MNHNPHIQNPPTKEDFNRIWNEEVVVHSQEEKDKNWNPIEAQIAPRKNNARIYRLLSVSVAASVILFAVLYFTDTFSNTTSASIEWVSFENASNNTKQIILADQSHIILAPYSTLTYNKSFTSDRKIQLKGKAFFQVTKDADHPFSVQTGDYTTTVLGTSFMVDAIDSQSISVQLYEGKVSIKKENNPQTFILSPGQQFKSSSDQQGGITTLYNIQKEEMYFQQADLVEVLGFIQSIHQKPFTFEKDIPNTKISVKISAQESLDQQLQTLSSICGYSFTIQENTIVVQP